jgi:hypothetical protein
LCRNYGCPNFAKWKLAFSILELSVEREEKAMSLFNNDMDRACFKPMVVILRNLSQNLKQHKKSELAKLEICVPEKRNFGSLYYL